MPMGFLGFSIVSGVFSWREVARFSAGSWYL